MPVIQKVFEGRERRLLGQLQKIVWPLKPRGFRKPSLQSGVVAEMPVEIVDAAASIRAIIDCDYHGYAGLQTASP